MHRRSWWACVAIVLSVHGVAGWAVLRAAAPSGSGAGPRPNAAIRWVRLAAAPDAGRPARPAVAAGRGEAVATPAATAPAPAVIGRTDASPPSAPDLPPAEAFLPSSELDMAARPRSAPDTSVLEGLRWSGLPMRVRLFVDAGGTVVDVQVLQSRDADDVVQRVRQMFLSTGFIAGRANGRDVPSYKDIELAVGDGAVRRPARQEGDPDRLAAADAR